MDRASNKIDNTLTLAARIQGVLVRLTAAYLRRSSIQTARWRLAKYAIAGVRKDGSRLGHAVVKTQYGFLMDLALGDWVDQHIFATGNYEDPISMIIQSTLRTGNTFIDVGANIGFFSLLASKTVGPQGSVTAFEPGEVQRIRLERNIALNRFDNIAVAPVALSDESGEAIFHLGPLQNSGISSLCIHRESAGTTTIKTITFDEVWNQDKPVHLFKIDVEGAEAKVLRGMSRCLNRWAPNIVLEVTDDALHRFGDSAANLCNCLIDRGYSMYWIEWNGLRPLAGWADDLPSQFNAFFTTQSSRQLPLPLIEGVLVNTS